MCRRGNSYAIGDGREVVSTVVLLGHEVHLIARWSVGGRQGKWWEQEESEFLGRHACERHRGTAIERPTRLTAQHTSASKPSRRDGDARCLRELVSKFRASFADVQAYFLGYHGYTCNRQNSQALEARRMEPARKKSKWDDLDHSEAELKTKVKKQKKVKSAPPPVASTSNLPFERISTGLQGCRSVYNYERLNHIEEGSYGVVSRARDKETGEMFVRSLRAQSLNASAASP
jgi:hypothetical protein